MQSFLSQWICQDPLERFFGMQRQRGEVHDIPSANEFLKNTHALRVVGGLHMTGVKRGIVVVELLKGRISI